MFDTKYYDRLQRCRLLISKKTNTSMIGSRKSARKGHSAEFSDFREYMPGDDIRGIDWNAYARLDRLYIKEYMEEKEGSVHLFLDTSKSMDYGEKKKSELMKELAAALAYISVSSQDHVKVYDLGKPGRPFTANNGKAGFRNLQVTLEKMEVGEKADILEGVRRTGNMAAGLTVILSDFLDEKYFPEKEEKNGELDLLLRYLAYQKQKVVLLHILAEEEVEIDMTGSWNLIDSEDETSKVMVDMEQDTIDRYKEQLNAFTKGLQVTCKKHGAIYHLCHTGQAFDKIIFDELRDIYEH